MDVDRPIIVSLAFDEFVRGMLDAVGVTPTGPVVDDTSLFDDLEFDSFHVLELLAYIDEHLDAAEPPPEPDDVQTVGDAYRYYLSVLSMPSSR